MAVPSGQARLTQDALFGLGIQIEGRLAGDGHRPGLRRMVVLTMAALLAHQHPAILVGELNGFADRRRHLSCLPAPSLSSRWIAVRIGSGDHPNTARMGRPSASL